MTRDQYEALEPAAKQRFMLAASQSQLKEVMGYAYVPPKVVEAPPQPSAAQSSPGWLDRHISFSTIFTFIVAACMFAFGCIMIIDGFSAQSAESRLAEQSAIRQGVNVLTYSAGFVIVALGTIIMQLSGRQK